MSLQTVFKYMLASSYIQNNNEWNESGDKFDGGKSSTLELKRSQRILCNSIKHYT